MDDPCFKRTFKLAPFFQRHQQIEQKESQCLIKGQLFLGCNTSKNVEVIITNHTFLIKNDQSSYFSTKIDFSLKFQVILQRNQIIQKKIGFRLTKQHFNGFVQLYTFDSNLSKKWINVLKRKANQLGFHQQFKPVRKLGKGQFAAVFEVQCFQTGSRFAVKGFSKLNLMKMNRGIESLENEIKIMRSFNHPNLQNLHSVYETQNSLYIVTELLKGGSLFDRFHKMQKLNRKLNMDNVRQLMQGVFEGLNKLQELNIVHRDLKLDNIMLRDTNSFQPVIIDFGLATFSDEPDYIYQRCGTPGFVSPQVINSTKSTKIPPKSDIYSSGAIMYQLLASKPLFLGKTPEQVLKSNKTFSCILDQQTLSGLPKDTVNLLQGMLKFDVEERISAKQALAHQFFSKKTKIKVLQNISNKNMGPVVFSSVCSSFKTIKDQNQF